MIELHHLTGLANARNIIKDSFRVPYNNLMEDRCANFYEGSRLSSKAENTGCTLTFEWYGQIVEDPTDEIRLITMTPGVLYRKKWRSVIVPDTLEGLKFRSAIIEDGREHDFYYGDGITKRIFSKAVNPKSFLSNSTNQNVRISSMLSIVKFRFVVSSCNSEPKSQTI